jgi:Spy/CpxP family protein refolding chaperone
MKRTFARRVLCWAALASLAVAFASVDQPVLGADAPVKKMLSKRSRRLPANYAPVVTEEQREKIFKIQEEYQAKIAPLETQLKELRKERDDKIAAVLTAEQKKKIEEAAAKAKEKKAAKPAETTPAAPPAESKPEK